MKIFSMSMVLVCHHCILAFQVWARGSPFRIGPEPEPVNLKPCLPSVAWKAKGGTPERPLYLWLNFINREAGMLTIYT
jgi:hypothetical protein